MASSAAMLYTSGAPHTQHVVVANESTVWNIMRCAAVQIRLGFLQGKLSTTQIKLVNWPLQEEAFL